MKFYTPEIEEIHSGFEIEYLDDGKWEEGVFCGLTVREWHWSEVEKDIKNKAIRVRFLDRELIEKEGWEYKRKAFKHNVYQKELLIGLESLSVQLMHIEITNHVLITKGNSTLFSGKIKNVSELRKLIKQITHA